MLNINWPPEVPQYLIEKDILPSIAVRGNVTYKFHKGRIGSITMEVKKPSDKQGIDVSERTVVFEATEEITEITFTLVYSKRGRLKHIIKTKKFFDVVTRDLGYPDGSKVPARDVDCRKVPDTTETISL